MRLSAVLIRSASCACAVSEALGVGARRPALARSAVSRRSSSASIRAGSALTSSIAWPLVVVIVSRSVARLAKSAGPSADITLPYAPITPSW